MSVLGIGAAGTFGHTAEAASTFRVVGTGDSILGMSFGVAAPGGAVTSSGRWIDTEYGRQPYVAGMSGRASTASIWPLVLARSQPGGWIIIQDNGAGVSDSNWRTLLHKIVADTPEDRCLLFVLPVARADINPTLSADAIRRASIMAVEAVGQSCHATIPWNTAVNNDPSMVVTMDSAGRPDGQHPSARGRIWLARAINNWVG